MARVISASEAQNSFGAIVQWAEENHEEVVVERRGRPAVAIVPYAEYEYLMQLREERHRRKIFEEIEELRREVALHNTDLTSEEAYRLAGFSEEAIRSTLASDKRLSGE